MRKRTFRDKNLKTRVSRAMTNLPQIITGFIAGVLLIETSSVARSEETLEEILRSVPADYHSSTKKVTEKLSRFRESTDKTKTQLFKKLDQIELSSRRIGGATAAKIINQVQSAKKWVDRGAEIEECDALLIPLFEYAERIAAARDEIGPCLKKLVDELNQDKQTKLVLKIEDVYSKLGGFANAEVVIKEKSIYKGFRTSLDGGDVITLRVEFGSIVDDRIEGKIERDWMYKGHPVHALRGALHGLKIFVETGETLSFGNNLDGNWKYEGYAFGKSIVGCYYGTTRKQKAGCGYFHVKK
jgi:hypothetical protein